MVGEREKKGPDGILARGKTFYVYEPGEYRTFSEAEIYGKAGAQREPRDKKEKKLMAWQCFIIFLYS